MYIEDLFCSVAAMLPHRDQKTVVALCYHRLSDYTDGTPLDRFTLSPKTFAHHVSIIRESGLKVIGPDRFFETTEPAIMITFDDNLPSHVQEALPVLADSGIAATFFLNPRELDHPGQLSGHDVDALLEAGMWVGAHSNERLVASLYSPSEFEAEAISNRDYLRSIGMPLMWAYPGGFIGSYHETNDDVLRRHGFRLRFSTLEEPCDPRDPRRVQGRYVIRNNCSDRYFRAALAGGLGLLRLYKKSRARIRPQPRSLPGTLDLPQL